MSDLTKEQQEASIAEQHEVNRVREMLLKGVRESPEASRMPMPATAIAAMSIAIEALGEKDREAAREELHKMLDFVVNHVIIVPENEIN